LLPEIVIPIRALARGNRNRPNAGFRLALFVAVFGGVVFAGLFGVVRGVVQVALGYVSMVSGLFMMARLVVFRAVW
jgi:hypothetical protein